MKPKRKNPPTRAPEPTGEAPLDEVDQRQALPFPVVALGASAGGVEALTQLLRALPADIGMAFVIVQHLDPTHSSFLSDILSRATSIPIGQVEDQMRVEPNRIYVIPPGTTMEITRGVLRLSPRTEKRGQSRPIDHFLRSLADDQGYKSVGVILSGTATDGTLGLTAIKAEGGITFAQDDTAQHTGMPRNAIAEGCVDFVLPPDEIAKELARIARHPLVGPAAESIDDSRGEPNLNRIIESLRFGTGVDFRNYKRNTLYRRILRRVVLHKLANLKEYGRFLQNTPGEIEALYQDILINVTNFFRNPEAYEVLKSHVFPRLTQGRSRHEPVRIWVLGCSTGEEAYSIAIAFAEFTESSGRPIPVQVFATDLNGTGIERARAGVYSKGIAPDVSPERLRRFFVEVDGNYRIRKDIRDVCVFARHNVLSEPPFSRIDLITCRNVLIYLEPSVQQRILPILHYALRPEGFLWLGSSETIGPHRDLFDLEESRQKIYAKKPGGIRIPLLAGLGGYTVDSRGPSRRGTGIPRPVESGPIGIEVQKEADRILLSKFAPPSVLVDGDLEILQFRGETGHYLAPMPGKASLNLLKLLREGLLVGVRGAVHKAKRQEAVVREEGLRVKSNGGYRDVNVSVIPVKANGGAEGMFLVLFEDHAAAGVDLVVRPVEKVQDTSVGQDAEHEIQRLKQELAATREYLQSVIEQQEAANEELQSANEEVQSSNEELQSINEELETSKEEIQSSNEELATVNEELQNRNLELGQSNNDLLNLLTSVQMAIVMLGPDLRIRRFTSPAEKLLNLIAADVGRPISDIKINLDIPDLENELAQVIDTVTVREFEVQDRAGRWFSVRLRPYRTLENKIDGVVIVLFDVDTLKRSQEKLLRQMGLLEQAHEPILMWPLDGPLTYWNRGAEEVYGFSRDEALGRNCHELLKSSVPAATFRAALERQGFWNGEIEQERRDGAKIVVESRMVLLREAEQALVLETNSPITERKQMEQALRQRADDLIVADKNKNEFLAMLAHELRNPLAPLRNAVQLVQEPQADPEMKAHAHEMMERQIQNMARMVDDLLDAARMTQGKIKILRSPVLLDELLARTVDAYRAGFDAKDQEVALSLPDEPVWVVGDGLRLEQMFGNLLHNAAKFTQRHGHVWVSMAVPRAAAKKDPLAEIRIRDDGVGIEREMLERVFDLFQQGDHSLDRAQGGLGIGLTLVHHILELHGGSIEVLSAGPSQGSEFVVRLPADTGVKARRVPKTNEREITLVPPRRILVVDDNVDSADSLTMLLRLAGHSVQVTYDGSKALELAESFKPDAVLLDIGLPGLNGYDTARELRRRRGMKDTLLIALTGYGRDDDRRRAEEAGFDHHLVKPAEFDSLQELLGSSRKPTE